MNKLFKRIAAMGAAVMMTVSISAMGASAVFVDLTESYSTTYYRTSCLARLDGSDKSYYARNLTTCKLSTYKLYASVEVFNSSENSIGFDEQSKTNPSVGNILTPNIDGNSYTGKYAEYTTYYQTSAGSGRKMDSARIDFVI